MPRSMRVSAYGFLVALGGVGVGFWGQAQQLESLLWLTYIVVAAGFGLSVVGFVLYVFVEIGSASVNDGRGSSNQKPTYPWASDRDRSSG